MLKFKKYLDEVAKPTGDLKKACWTGYTAVGTKQKNGRTVPNCVPEEVELEEVVKHDPWKQKYFGPNTVVSNRKMSDKEKADWEKHKEWRKSVDAALASDMKRINKEEVEFYEQYDAEELFDILEEVVDGIAEESNIDSDILWENLEDVSDEELFETAAWRRKEGKNPTGGLNRKGIMSYRRENPGSKLKMAVTGKVKPGSKAAKRRKSFCARMSGMKGPMKKPNGKPTRKALALRKWKCR
jgi:hypothetical protein